MIGYGTRQYSAGLSEEYGGIEYGGLPVFVCILQQMHQCPAAEPSRLFCTRLVLSCGVVAIMAVRHKV
jgi:hypothetical protein